MGASEMNFTAGVASFAAGVSEVWQVTQLTKTQRDILTALNVGAPAKVPLARRTVHYG
jgi:hypothetical protein